MGVDEEEAKIVIAEVEKCWVRIAVVVLVVLELANYINSKEKQSMILVGVLFCHSCLSKNDFIMVRAVTRVLLWILAW